MKKASFLLFALFFACTSFAQDDDGKYADKHEVKLNTTNLIAFAFLDGSYEYLINEESSFGIALLLNLDDDDIDLLEYRSYSVTPYYRQYFSKKYAKGFFVEGFGMLNGRKGDIDVFDNNFNFVRTEERTSTNFALGISAGGKFVTPRGFVAEIYLGLGRNLLEDDTFFDDLVGRGGISLGYRF